MTSYGLLIDNEYCTGCHSCEIACQNEHSLPGDQWGIKVLELGPIKLMEAKKWEWRYIPALTSYCRGRPSLCTPLPRAGHPIRPAGNAG